MNPEVFKGLARILAPSAGGSLADRAAAENLVQPRDLEDCLQEQARSGKALGEILVARGLIGADVVERLLHSSLPPEAAAVATDPLRALNQYLLVSLFGSGGMADVWKAWDGSLCRWVAIKILKDSVGHGPQRIEREGRTAGGLLHPNIIPIHEVGVHQGHPYLVMPLIDGRPLEVPKDSAEAVRIILEIAVALHYVHQRGILHRDVKPANILLDQGGRPLLGDFGLAVPKDRKSSGWFLSGTPQYASPEQLRGEPLDPGTDIFSLGATLYHLVAGRPPYPGGTPEEIRAAQAQGPPSWPLRLSPGLKSILKKSMALRRTDRYGSMEEFAVALKSYQAGSGLSALKRPRTLLALGFAALLVCSTTYLILWAHLRSNERTEAIRAYREGDRLLREGERSLQGGSTHLPEARRKFSQAIPEFFTAMWLMRSDYPQAGAGLGRSYELLGQFERAEKEYLKCGDFPEARLGLARIGFRRYAEGWAGKNWRAVALQHLEGIEASSSFPLVGILRSFADGRWEEILEKGPVLIQGDLTDDLLLFILGRSARETGHWTEALQWLEAARELRGESPAIFEQLGRTYLALGQKEKARTAFLRAAQSADPAWLGLPGTLQEIEKLKN